MRLELSEAERRLLENILGARRVTLIDCIRDAEKPNNGKRLLPNLRRELSAIEKILGALDVKSSPAS